MFKRLSICIVYLCIVLGVTGCSQQPSNESKEPTSESTEVVEELKASDYEGRTFMLDPRATITALCSDYFEMILGFRDNLTCFATVTDTDRSFIWFDETDETIYCADIKDDVMDLRGGTLSRETIAEEVNFYKYDSLGVSEVTNVFSEDNLVVVKGTVTLNSLEHTNVTLKLYNDNFHSLSIPKDTSTVEIFSLTYSPELFPEIPLGDYIALEPEMADSKTRIVQELPEYISLAFEYITPPKERILRRIAIISDDINTIDEAIAYLESLDSVEQPGNGPGGVIAFVNNANYTDVFNDVMERYGNVEQGDIYVYSVVLKGIVEEDDLRNCNNFDYSSVNGDYTVVSFTCSVNTDVTNAINETKAELTSLGYSVYYPAES